MKKTREIYLISVLAASKIFALCTSDYSTANFSSVPYCANTSKGYLSTTFYNLIEMPTIDASSKAYATVSDMKRKDPSLVYESYTAGTIPGTSFSYSSPFYSFGWNGSIRIGDGLKLFFPKGTIYTHIGTNIDSSVSSSDYRILFSANQAQTDINVTNFNNTLQGLIDAQAQNANIQIIGAQSWTIDRAVSEGITTKDMTAYMAPYDGFDSRVGLPSGYVRSDLSGPLNQSIFVDKATIDAAVTTIAPQCAGRVSASGKDVSKLCTYMENGMGSSSTAGTSGTTTTTQTTTTGTSTVTLSLAQGWNLVSSPVDCKELSASALSNVTLYAFDGNTQTYTLNPPAIKTATGYWAYSPTATNIDVTSALSASACEDSSTQMIAYNKWFLLGTQKGVNSIDILRNTPTAKIYTYSTSSATWSLNPQTVAGGTGFWFAIESQKRGFVSYKDIFLRGN